MQPPDRPRPRLEAQARTERPHVLIVADDPDLAGFLAEGLPLGGFWTSVIASGLQALEVFRLRQFDLVVVDAGLQGFDAVEFMRRLRGVSVLDPSRAARTEAPAVFIVSESGGVIDPEETRALGIVASLAPPIELDNVVRTLHGVFESWRQDHPDTPLADSSNRRAF